MDEMVYNSLSSYFHALSLKGYLPWHHVEKLLILLFIKDFVYHDFRAVLTIDDYREIEKALECLYGTTCLIPYPDYLKMGKLYLGEITELSQRVQSLEVTPVLKLIHDLNSAEDIADSDIAVMQNEDA